MPFPHDAGARSLGHEALQRLLRSPCPSRVWQWIDDCAARYSKAGSFHSARLEAAPLGHFFHVNLEWVVRSVTIRRRLMSGMPLRLSLTSSTAAEPEGNAG